MHHQPARTDNPRLSLQHGRTQIQTWVSQEAADTALLVVAGGLATLCVCAGVAKIVEAHRD